MRLDSGFNPSNLFPPVEAFASIFLKGMKSGKVSRKYVELATLCQLRGEEFKGIAPLLLISLIYAISGEKVIGDDTFYEKLQELAKYISTDMKVQNTGSSSNKRDNVSDNSDEDIRKRFISLVTPEDDEVSQFLARHFSDTSSVIPGESQDDSSKLSDDQQELLRFLREEIEKLNTNNDDEEKDDEESPDDSSATS